MASGTAAWIFGNLAEQQGSKRFFWLKENANTTLQQDEINTGEPSSFGNRCISLAVCIGQINRRVPQQHGSSERCLDSFRPKVASDCFCSKSA